MPDLPAPEKRPVPIGDWLSQALNLTNAHLGPHLVLGLVVGLMCAVAGFTVIGGILVGWPLNCGCFLYARKRMTGQAAELGDVFRGFDVFGECMLLSLILLGIGLVMGLVIAIPSTIVALVGMCCMPLLVLFVLIMVALGVALGGSLMGMMFLLPGLIFERRMAAMDALKLSFAFFRANYALAGYGVAVYLIMVLGTALTLGLGMIFLIPFAVFAGTVVYRDWIGFQETPAVEPPLLTPEPPA